MSVPQTPGRSRKRLFIGLGVLGVVVIALLTPVLVFGAFMIPVAKVKFGETTGSLSATSANATVETMVVYQYMFSARTGGMIQTSDSDVAASRGTVNITMSLKLTNPSGQTLDLGHANVSGGLGTRNHTIYLGASEGVRVPGSYKLDVVITADVSPVVGAVELNLTTTVTVNFTVS